MHRQLIMSVMQPSFVDVFFPKHIAFFESYTIVVTFILQTGSFSVLRHLCYADRSVARFVYW